MKYCYCVTAKIGHGGVLVGWGAGWLGGLRGQDCGTANHTEGEKRRRVVLVFLRGGAVGDLGFQLRQRLPPQLSLTVTIPTTGTLCVVVCVFVCWGAAG